MSLHWPLLVFARWSQQLDAGLPETAALAAVALIGYLFGRRTRTQKAAEVDAQRQRELERASGIARQLESIAQALRHDLASHHGQLARFKRRLSEARDVGDSQSWRSLCVEAELILTPTMQLAQHLSLAYDAIRQQSDALETFTQGRTDALTGLGSGRALSETTNALVTTARRSGAEFSVALVSLDREPGERADRNQPANKARLPEVARLIQSCMRDTDFAARYGDEELAVLMPQTKLSGACVFAQRLRQMVVERMHATVGCGIAEFQAGDSEKSLFGRADSALYSAKAAGPNRQFVHSGSQIREHRDSGSAAPVDKRCSAVDDRLANGAAILSTAAPAATNGDSIPASSPSTAG